MGYSTRYSLYIMEGNNITETIKKLRDTVESAEYTIDENGDAYDEIKWYDHVEDMAKFSKMFPNHLFKLSGVGEGECDSWDKYFQNGKMQHCKAKITIEGFDSNKLK